MIRARTLVLPGAAHRRLAAHLFPGDGKEAAAVLLCTRVERAGLKLLVRRVIEVPHQECRRSPVSLTWPGEYLDRALEAAETDGLSILLLHSHPSGPFEFSHVDDESDQVAVRALITAAPVDAASEPWHGSAVMVPGGAMKARVYDRLMRAHPVDLVAAYGDELRFFWNDDRMHRVAPMAFSDQMTVELGKLSAAVVGASGTGSVVLEQLLRLGWGELIAIDHDRVEAKNLNRILNTTEDDATRGNLKVDVLKAAAGRIRPDTHFRAVACGIRDAVEVASEADVLFCCVDTLEGRHICDRLATAMLQPLFDVGVIIPVRKPERGLVVAGVCGRVDYVQPGGSTLADRRVYTPEMLTAEYLRRVAPAAYADRLREGYMPGTGQEAPSVISVNMHAASSVVLEFLARAFPYRLGSEANAKFARTEFDLAAGEYQHVPESEFQKLPTDLIATGLNRPLLGLPELEGRQQWTG